MIYKPYSTIKFNHYTDINTDACTINDIIEKFECSEEYKRFAKEFGLSDNIGYEDVYIKHKNSLLSLNENKHIADVFRFFKTRKIELVYFYIAGGASVNCEGYKFVVHPDEDIHKYTPHVHVKRNGNAVRYHLDTLEKFKQDDGGREFERDEKKIIIPGLKKHRKQLWGYWNYYMGGYVPPEIDEEGYQYYKES